MKKVKAILAVKEPKTCKQVWVFISMVNYYKDMWQQCTHLLTQQTKLMGKGTKFQWMK